MTHNGNLPLIAESAFHIDVEEDLPSVEEFVLADVRERFPRAGGNEYFRAAFDEVLLVVSAALAGGKIVHELADLPAYSAPPTDDLSEMTGDQLDAAIQRFAMDHGVSVTKVIRWLGADGAVTTIKRTGFVPQEIATAVEALWREPARLFSVPGKSEKRR